MTMEEILAVVQKIKDAWVAFGQSMAEAAQALEDMFRNLGESDEQSAPRSQSPPTHKYQRWHRAAYGTAPPRHPCSSELGRLWGLSSPLRFFDHSRTIFITPFIHIFDKRLSVHIADTVCFL